MASIPDLRDEVYTQIGVKKALDQFTFNNFDLVRTWLPKQTFEELNEKEEGILYIIGGVFGDRFAVNRIDTASGEMSVRVGYQRVITDVEDVEEIDTILGFVEEIEYLCRKAISRNTEYAYTRTEYEKDSNGVPYSFIHYDQFHTFESYFTVFYKITLP